MMNQLIAQSLMHIVPEKRVAVVTISPDTTSPETVTVFNAWIKPVDVQLSDYVGLNLQGNETRIKIPDNELNPDNNGREIRPRDTIVMDGTTYNVLAAKLKSVRTVWECIARREIS